MPHRRRSIVARDPAAVKRKSGVSQSVVDAITNQVVNEKRHTAHAQSLPREALKLIGRKMMHEEIGTDQIERVIGERQRERVARNGAAIAVEVSAGAIKKSNFQIKLWRKPLSDFGWNETRAGGNFEQGSASPTFAQRASHQIRRSAHSAEPCIEHL